MSVHWFQSWKAINSACKDFPDLAQGWILAPSQLKNEQKRPKMVYIIPNFLDLHLVKISWKSEKKMQLQMHENSHKNVNENMFSFTFLYKFSCVYMKGN